MVDILKIYIYFGSHSTKKPVSYMHGKFDIKNLELTLGGGLVKSEDPILGVNLI